MTPEQMENDQGSVQLDPLLNDTNNEGNYLLRKYGFPYPWDPTFIFSKEGCEHTHVLIWVAKDYCWSQNLPTAAIVMGSIALFWCCIVMYHAIQERDAENIYMVIGTALWLFANYWWMFWEETGEDDVNHDRQTNPMFLAAFVYVAVFFIVLKPFKIIRTRKEETKRCVVRGLIPRFNFLENWTQYEHLHSFFWIGKDYCWNSKNEYLWPFFLLPTMLISLDFIWSTLGTRKLLMVDCGHYVTLFLWLMGNASWSIGEVFVQQDDTTYSLDDSSKAAMEQGRWWSSWILLLAFFAAGSFYGLWICLSCLNYSKAEYARLDAVDEGDAEKKNSGLGYPGPNDLVVPSVPSKTAHETDEKDEFRDENI